MCSAGNARNPQIWPVSLSQNSAKIRKSTDHGHKLISSEDGQDTSACKISGQSLHAFSGKCPETYPDGRTDGHAVKQLRLVGWTNGPTYRSKEGISGFGRPDGRTDGQPENIMPPAPKCGGIKTWEINDRGQGWRSIDDMMTSHISTGYITDTISKTHNFARWVKAWKGDYMAAFYVE